MSESPKDLWEGVLATVEAEIRRSELVLAPDHTLTPADRSRAQRRALTEPAPLVLPDPDVLPPAPPEIRERLLRLYHEIDEVAAAIRTALQQARTAQRLLPESPRPSVFVDRRA